MAVSGHGESMNFRDFYLTNWDTMAEGLPGNLETRLDDSGMNLSGVISTPQNRRHQDCKIYKAIENQTLK